MLNLNSLIVFSPKPANLVEFYSEVFETEPSWTNGDFSGFRVGDGFMTIGKHSKVLTNAKEPERIMLNFESSDVMSDFERIKKLGATVIAKPYKPKEMEDGLIATFADPDGNYFQLMAPWENNNSNLKEDI